MALDRGEPALRLVGTLFQPSVLQQDFDLPPIGVEDVTGLVELDCDFEPRDTVEVLLLERGH